MEFLTDLQNIYSNIEKFAGELTLSLQNQKFIVNSGWYNGHYHKENNNWVRESYPIKVLTLENFCDIEIGLFNVSLTTKMSKENVLDYNFCNINNLKYDIYGVKNYLLDFKAENNDEKEIKDKLKNSFEKNIFFSFYFELDFSKKNIESILDTIEILKQGKFFY